MLTFLIFNVIPGGDPALRMAGRQPDPGQLEIIREQWGFNEPIYVQYEKTMEKVFNGDLISYSTQQNVIDEIKDRAPRTFALAIGAAILWMVVSVALGLFNAVHAGQFSDRFLTMLALVGISMPVFWIGALMNYYLGFKWGLFPNGGYVPSHGGPVAVVLPPDHALDRAVDPVHRGLLAHPALERPGHDERRLRAHGAREGPRRSARSCSATSCAIRSYRSSRCGGSTSAPCSAAARSSPRQCSTSRALVSTRRSPSSNLDVPPVLAITMYGAFFIVLLNTIVDIVYAALDPRVRLA